jgi:amino acid permease
MIFLIIGIILMLTLIIIALFFFMILFKSLIEEDIQKNGPKDQKLIDNRDPTIMSRSQNKD